MLNSRFDPKWWYGGPWDIWIRRVDTIGAFIREHKLKAVPADELPAHPYYGGEVELQAKAAMRPRPFPGGIIGPHLHFKGEVFLLDRDQWKSFSAAAIEQYRDRLGKAGTVGFEQLMDLSASIERL